MTVHEVVNLTGITARTLHYYDEIGLLKPRLLQKQDIDYIPRKI